MEPPPLISTLSPIRGGDRRSQHNLVLKSQFPGEKTTNVAMPLQGPRVWVPRENSSDAGVTHDIEGMLDQNREKSPLENYRYLRESNTKSSIGNLEMTTFS